MAKNLPKVAVFFGGRILAHEKHRVIPHLIKFKERYDATFFVSENASAHDPHYTQFFCDIFEIPPERHMVSVTTEPKEVTLFTKREETSYHKVWSMYYHNFQCMQLIREYADKHNVVFDIVVKYRGDIHSREVLDLFHPIQVNTVYIPVGNDWMGGLNDQIAYGGMEAMTKYCQCLQYILPMCTMGILYHPETLLRSYIQGVCHLNVSRIPFMYQLAQYHYQSPITQSDAHGETKSETSVE